MQDTQERRVNSIPLHLHNKDVDFQIRKRYQEPSHSPHGRLVRFRENQTDRGGREARKRSYSHQPRTPLLGKSHRRAKQESKRIERPCALSRVLNDADLKGFNWRQL